MPVENVETLIIGGGQAGLVMSEQLSKRGLPHLILERHRIAERWRSERWDGLHANGPAWHDRLSLFPIAGVDPDGFATREDIDEGMRLGCGHPMGPLTLCDFIGLDVLYAVCDSLYEEFKRPEYAPPPLLKRMVVSGHHGRKAGRGFYDYT